MFSGCGPGVPFIQPTAMKVLSSSLYPLKTVLGFMASSVTTLSPVNNLSNSL